MEKIFVTKTYLPPREEYDAYIDRIWESSHITNNGPLLKEFELSTQQYLGTKNFISVTNGTLALQIAIRSLGIEGGEIITTPFSYVATTSAILWEHCNPVFVDIDPQTFNIDPSKIEAAITEDTKAILAVHVFGNPCDIEAIDAIAKKRGIKVIYDGAHAFGAVYKGRALLDNGDVSIGSFHATKLFHTIEGGCIISQDKSVHDRAELMRRFGHTGDEHITLGINAKPSEFQAAMGLCNLKYIDGLIEKRAKLSKLYDSLLGSSFQKQVQQVSTDKANYAYYPILFKSEPDMFNAMRRLNKMNIFPRRYFYPSLNKLPYLSRARECAVSEDIASRILCLPLYADLSEDAVKLIAKELLQ